MAYVAWREPSILHITKQEKPGDPNYGENAMWAFIYASGVVISQPGLHLDLRHLHVPREEVGRRSSAFVD